MKNQNKKERNMFRAEGKGRMSSPEEREVDCDRSIDVWPGREQNAHGEGAPV